MPNKLKKLLIVDGYNVLRCGLRYKHIVNAPYNDWDSSGFNLAREKLISDVATFTKKEYDAIIVFDAADNPSSKNKHFKKLGIKIIYSPFNVTADSIIERTVHEELKRYSQIKVVTNDISIQKTVVGHKVLRLGSCMFCKILNNMENDIELTYNNHPNTLKYRLNKETLAKLNELRY